MCGRQRLILDSISLIILSPGKRGSLAMPLVTPSSLRGDNDTDRVGIIGHASKRRGHGMVMI